MTGVTDAVPGPVGQVMLRPQPLGVLPLPAGWLVLPADVLATPDGAAARDRLLAGMLPDEWPPGLEVLRLAAEGRAEEAAVLCDPATGPVAAYNHFVLTGAPASLEAARTGCAAAGPDVAGAADLAVLVAVAGYVLGHTGELPEVAGTDGEVAAHLLAAHASRAWAARDAQRALDLLVAAEEAAAGVSPVLAALLLGQQAGLLHEVNGADPAVVDGYREAAGALRGLDAVEAAAGELTLGLATAYQELAARAAEAPGADEGAGQPLLVEAVRSYHLALRLLRKESQPHRYAFAHSNLALAYLAMPMREERDKLRRGVAVQSLREALTHYTREDYPAEWAAVTLNLANALQHLPTTHPVENLVEAVGMYDELLEVRTVERDPLGHARVLANQGTALSHLGIHDRARERLTEARELFLAHGEDGAAGTVAQALDEIDRVRGAVGATAPDGRG